MARYLIETHHTPEQCLADLDAVLEQAPGLLQRLEWGCRTGVHTGWATLEASSLQEASRQIPSTLRSWTYPALVDRVTLTDSGFADHLLSNSSGDRYPRAECRLLRL